MIIKPGLYLMHDFARRSGTVHTLVHTPLYGDWQSRDGGKEKKKQSLTLSFSNWTSSDFTHNDVKHAHGRLKTFRHRHGYHHDPRLRSKTLSSWSVLAVYIINIIGTISNIIRHLILTKRLRCESFTSSYCMLCHTYEGSSKGLGLSVFFCLVNFSKGGGAGGLWF